MQQVRREHAEIEQRLSLTEV